MNSLSNWFDHYMNQIIELVDRYPFENKDAYAKWMNQHYHLVKNSTRYLAFAASLVELENGEEFKWWAKHLRDETDHDRVLLNDMHSLGYEPKDEPLPETRALIGSQYYDIQKNGPDALLGYALLLEGLSCKRCNETAERVERAHGSCSRFLRLHGEVDQEHFPEGLKRLEQFSHDRKFVILNNLHMAGQLYIYILKKLTDLQKAAIKGQKSGSKAA